MSAGSFLRSVYESNAGLFFSVSVQPETLTLTLNSVANDAGTGTPGTGFPSAKVSGSLSSIGVNTRKVRVRFTTTFPPGYDPNGVISLPVLTPTAFNAYGRGQTGTYTLQGTDYDVEFVGKTPERIN